MELARAQRRSPFGERYEVRRTLGQGGMGVVYEAFDNVRRTRVALKTMRQLDPVALSRFKNEFRSLADVTHPNLTALHELESEGEQTFFTMEYVEGVDFLQHVSRTPTPRLGLDDSTQDALAPSEDGAEDSVEPPLITGIRERRTLACDVGRLRSALRQLFEGVAALHVAGKLHRDLKPSNVFVTPQARVVILDFGLVSSLAHDGGRTLEGGVVGTPEYMSPEQAAASELSGASDLYSVGVMLYEALTGQCPYLGRPLRILIDKQQFDPPRPRDLVDGVPEDLDTLCMELLQRVPSRRPDALGVIARLGGAPAAAERAPLRPSTGPAMPARNLELVGRERHLQELTSAFEIASAGRPVVVYVHGGSGMGKTLLVKRFLASIAADAVVLSGRCYERESVPYKALDSIVDALSGHLRRAPEHEVDAVLPRDIHALTRIFPVLDRVPSVVQAPRRAHELSDPLELRRRAATALRELCGRMVMRRPLVLWIDDLQWGDLDSATLIQELLRSPDAPAVMLIASYRSEDASSALIAELRRKHGCSCSALEVRDLAVGALERDEARALALQLLGGEDATTRAQAALIADESQGNPFFVDELVQHLETGAAWKSGGPALRLDDVLHARTSELPTDARRLLEAIALAGRPIARRIVAQAADLEAEREATALAVLRTSRFVRSLRTHDEYDVETYHDRIRETVVTRLAPAARTALHLRIARALVARGNADPEALLLHLREGGAQVEAAEVAAVAAAKAVEALAFDRAAALWRIALDLSAPTMAPPLARALRANQGDALANAGRGAEAAAAYLAAAEGTSAADGLELRRRAAEQLLHSGHLEEGMRVLSDVLAAVGMKLSTTPWLTVLWLLAYGFLLRLRGLRYVPRAASEIPQDELTRIDVCWAVGAPLAIVRPILAKVFQRRHLLLSLRAGESTRVARGLALEGMSSALVGAPSRRRTQALLGAAHALADQLHDPYVSGWASGADGIGAYLTGRFRDALDGCDRATEEFRECSGASYEIASVAMFASQALFHLGEIGELSRRLPAYTQEARQRGDVYELTNVRIGWVNAAWLAADDIACAERELDDAMTQWGSPERQLQLYYELVARVQLELYRGRGLGALALIEAQWPAMSNAHLFRVQTVRIFVRHLRARAALSALAAGEVVGAEAAALIRAALRDASGILREGQRWSDGFARLVEAAVHLRRDDRARALEAAGAAIADFDASDMKLWAAAARWQRGELLGDDEGRAAVEAAEAQFRAQGVKDPARFCRMLAPGFGMHTPRACCTSCAAGGGCEDAGPAPAAKEA
jgi:serine/threonine protein kinase